MKITMHSGLILIITVHHAHAQLSQTKLAFLRVFDANLVAGPRYCIQHNPHTYTPPDVYRKGKVSTAIRQMVDLRPWTGCDINSLTTFWRYEQFNNTMAFIKSAKPSSNCTPDIQVDLLSRLGVAVIMISFPYQMFPRQNGPAVANETDVYKKLNTSVAAIFDNYSNYARSFKYGNFEFQALNINVLTYVWSSFIILIFANISIISGSLIAGKRKFECSVPRFYRDQQDALEDRDATYKLTLPGILFLVLYMSTVLVLLYVVLQYTAINIGQWLVLLYSTTGTIALTAAIRPVLEKIPVAQHQFRCKRFENAHKEEKVYVHIKQILAFIIAAFACVWYGIARNDHNRWLFQNIISSSISIFTIQTFTISMNLSFKTGTLFMLALIIYDVVFVFITPHFTSSGRSIMEEVAIGPGREISPFTLIGPWPGSDTDLFNCARYLLGASILGLGDVIIPGLITAYCYYFDVKKKRKLGASYAYPICFIISIVAYNISLIMAYIVVILTGLAQPALLYIGPAVILAGLLTTMCMGDLRDFWRNPEETKEIEIPRNHANFLYNTKSSNTSIPKSSYTDD